MGWFRHLFGRPAPLAMLRFAPTGGYTERIVGELSYQDQIARLAAGSPPDGSSCDVAVTAVLIWDDGNPVDDQAIQVQVDGLAVGYLTRASARVYRRWLEAAGHAHRPAACAARIVGGWDRGSRGRGYFGVELDVPAFYGPVPGADDEEK